MPENSLIDGVITVPCTLIPIQGYHLIVPNQCISEILIRNEIEQIDTANSWLVGKIKWMDDNLSVIQFEQLQNTLIPNLNKNNIIVVLQHPINDTDMHHFGLLAHQAPQVIRANNQSIDREINPKKMHDYALSYVKVGDKSAIIPDLSRLVTELEALNLKKPKNIYP